jgi:Zn-dependent M16 (insulinase) family peptidase
MELGMLTHILIGTPASPLRKALIDSGLGEDLAGGGLDTFLRQQTFSTGLKGIDPARAGEVEQLILTTLESLAREGIDPESVAASVNTVEFRLRENNTGQFPRGLSLMLRSLTSWLYGGHPIARLAFEGPLAGIKKHLADGKGYFEGLIQRYFLDNNHRTTVLLKPEEGYNQRIEAEENERLTEAQKQMNTADLQAIIDNTSQLKKRQETPDTPEALATIPSLSLSDLELENKLLPLEVQSLAGCKVLYHDLFTNGIVYLDIGFNLRALPQDLLPYVSLFGKSLVEIGTEKEDFVKLSQRMGRSTGGIQPTAHLSPVNKSTEGTYWLFLRGKATLKNSNELLAILRDILLTVKLDNRERFRQMVLEEKAEMESLMVPRGHVMVNTRLRAHFNQASWVAEQMGGIEYLFFLRQLSEAIDKDWKSVLAKLEAVRRVLISRKGVLVNVTLDQAGWNEVRPAVKAFLETLPATDSQHFAWLPPKYPEFEGLTIPAQVNYVGKGGNLYQLGYDYHASLMVISNYLRTTWLWEKVRVQVGLTAAL